MRVTFALQKLLTLFSTKNIGIFQISTFEILTKTLTYDVTYDVISFEQLDPGHLISVFLIHMKKPQNRK